MIYFGRAVEDLGDDVSKPVVFGESFDIAVVADGGWSELRSRYFEATRPTYAGYQAWRFRVESSAVPGFRAFGEYCSRLSASRTILLDIVINKGGDYVMGGTALACPESDVTKPSSTENRQMAGLQVDSADAATILLQQQQHQFLSNFKRNFGQHEHGELLRVMETAAARGKITSLPQYEFAARRVVNGHLILIGDAAHMASPRTAAGAHTAVQDGFALYQTFSRAMTLQREASVEKVIDEALREYGPEGTMRAQALLQRSLTVSAEVVPTDFRRADFVYLPPSLKKKES